MSAYTLFPDRFTVCRNSYGPRPAEEERKQKKKVDKNTCNKCNKRSGMTGHIFCIKCRQWQHLKCVGLNLSEAKLKKANYKCEDCK